MKNLLKIAVVALVFAQPLFAVAPPPRTVPDGGSSAVLAVISLAGLVAGSKLFKKNR